MDLAVGQKAHRSLTLTHEHVQKYAAITGDYNPLHIDPEYANETAFGGTPSFASSQMAGKSAARSPRRNGPRINRSNPEYESASMP